MVSNDQDVTDRKRKQLRIKLLVAIAKQSPEQSKVNKKAACLMGDRGPEEARRRMGTRS